VDLPTRHELRHQAYSLLFYDPHEHHKPIETVLKCDFANDVSFSFSLPLIPDAAPPAVDKGTAVRDVLELLQLGPEETAASDSGVNVLPMLRVVGHRHLTANSLFELFAAAAWNMERIA
jgi:hydroxymethylpyrimidine pyrophosphatase-like HAD family hydrolase